MALYLVSLGAALEKCETSTGLLLVGVHGRPPFKQCLFFVISSAGWAFVDAIPLQHSRRVPLSHLRVSEEMINVIGPKC